MALSKFHLLSLSILHTKPVSRKATTFANRSFADRDLRCSISLRRTFNTIAGCRGDPISTVLGTRRTGMLTTIVASGCSIYNFATSASAGRDGAATSKEEVFVKNTITSHDIVIFSKSYCPYCQSAKQLFFDLDKEPYVVELDERDDGADIQETLTELVGKQTVPQVFVKGKHVGGSDDTLEAYESGALTELLGSNPS